MLIVVDSRIFSHEAILLAVQPWLLEYHIGIEAAAASYVISIEPKGPEIPEIDEKAFRNDLVHGEFRLNQERKTRRLREILMERAFSVYGRGSAIDSAGGGTDD